MAIAEPVLDFALDSAGSLMSHEFIRVPQNYSADMAIAYIRKNVRGKENIHYIYIVDSDETLKGVVSLRKLLGRDDDQILKDFMETDLIVLPYDLDQELAARIFRDTDLVTIPVVDENNRIIGVIHVETILDVIQEEVTEDIHKMASISVDDMEVDGGLLQAPFRWLYVKRMPWLVILVFVNLLSGAGIANYEDLIGQYVHVVFFLPLLIASGGNTGSQSTTLVIRSMAIGDVTKHDWYKVMVKELFVALMLGITMAIAIAGIGYFRGSQGGVGIETAWIVGLAMVVVVLFGGLLGAILPFAFRFFKLDPATASTPLVTSICDIAGVFIYFGIASLFLNIG